MSALITVLIAVFVVAWGGGVIAFLVFAWNLCRVPFNIRAGVNSPIGSPFNSVFAPALLTESGLSARRLAGRALLWFVAMLVLGAASGGLAMVFAP
jgi:hypothetical protein